MRQLVLNVLSVVTLMVVVEAASAQFEPVGAPIGRPVGTGGFGPATGSFGSSATPIFQPVDFSNVVAPVPEIPTPENQSFFTAFQQKLSEILPFVPAPRPEPKTGWFPSLRRRNVQRHRMDPWQN